MPRSKDEIQVDIDAAKKEIAVTKIEVFDILEKIEYLNVEVKKADRQRQINLADIIATRAKVEQLEKELKESTGNG